MQLYGINLNVFLRKDHLFAFFTVPIICNLFLMSCVGLSSDSNDSISFDSDQSAADSNGPTVIMSYSNNKYIKNPIASFMYFVPLIAPTLVDNISSVNNEQQVGIISHKIITDAKTFRVICEFEISGKGFHKNSFDPAGIIEIHTNEVKEGETLTHMLDYIKVEGEGFGIIEVRGTMAGSTSTVTEVNMQFNANGYKSPVTIGLYDIKPKDGKYKYENRSNESVVRVNSLVFKKTEQTPRMGITIASIARKSESVGFLGWIKVAIANLFIRPLKVDELGNTTMLEFGDALLKKNATFTFPKAKNIKESNVVEIDIKQE